MLKTGNIFIDLFSEIVVFFPLLPVIIIFLRKIYQKEVLNFMMVLCVVNFSQNLALETLPAAYINGLSIYHMFALPELVLIVQVFRSVLKGGLREIVNVVTVALLSAMITYFIAKGIDQPTALLDIAQDGFIVLLSIYCLFLVVQREYMQIFYSPLFWIATGTLFYFVILMLLNIIEGCCMQLQRSVLADKTLLLNVASLARYFFYGLAALMYKKQPAS